MKCSHCKAKLEEEDLFCPDCGRKIEEEDKTIENIYDDFDDKYIKKKKKHKKKSHLKPAGLGIRFIAFLIDWILLSLLLHKLNEFLVFILVVAYYTYTTHYFGGTIGKLILRLRVIDKNGNYLTKRKSFLRFLSYSVSIMSLGIGFIYIGAEGNYEKKGFHDLIMKTRVIYKK